MMTTIRHQATYIELRGLSVFPISLVLLLKGSFSIFLPFPVSLLSGEVLLLSVLEKPEVRGAALSPRCQTQNYNVRICPTPPFRSHKLHDRAKPKFCPHVSKGEVDQLSIHPMQSISKYVNLPFFQPSRTTERG